MARAEFKYIAVEGVIGAGKTTLALQLSEWFGAYCVKEEFGTNPFLDDFYKDIKNYAFQTQIFFLLSRFKQQKQLRQYDLFHLKIISDYIFQKDRIFATLNLSNAEMKLYDGLAKVMEQDIAVPDFVIYLKSSTQRLLKNIKKRDREYEKDITEEYISSLNDIYDSFFAQYTTAPVLTLNMEEYDFVNSKEDFDKIVQLVSTKKGSRE